MQSSSETGREVVITMGCLSWWERGGGCGWKRRMIGCFQKWFVWKTTEAARTWDSKAKTLHFNATKNTWGKDLKTKLGNDAMQFLGFFWLLIIVKIKRGGTLRQSWHLERGRDFHRSDSTFYFSVLFPHRFPAINWLWSLRRSLRTRSLHLLLLYHTHHFSLYVMLLEEHHFKNCWNGEDLTASDEERTLVFMLCCCLKMLKNLFFSISLLISCVLLTGFKLGGSVGNR